MNCPICNKDYAVINSMICGCDKVFLSKAYLTNGYYWQYYLDKKLDIYPISKIDIWEWIFWEVSYSSIKDKTTLLRRDSSNYFQPILTLPGLVGLSEIRDIIWRIWKLKAFQ